MATDAAGMKFGFPMPEKTCWNPPGGGVGLLGAEHGEQTIFAN
jgi:hypothetical protein